MKETWAKNWEESRQGRFGQEHIRKWKLRDCTNFPYNYNYKIKDQIRSETAVYTYKKYIYFMTFCAVI